MAVTPRENFINALMRKPVVGHVPHFELVFFLTMEAFGKVHPLHRSYYQWNQMSANEQKLQLEDMAKIYIETAERYNHSAIFVHPNPGRNGDLPGNNESTRRILETIRDLSGDRYCLMVHGDPTLAIPTGDTMMDFVEEMYEEPDAVHDRTKRRFEEAVSQCDELARHKGLCDGFILCSDYCFNTNPFYSRDMFAEFVAPYLKDILSYYRENGFYSIKHTDGNVLPILDMIVDCQPDAIHSLDPQGGVSIPEARKIIQGRTAICGNVNCGLLQTGTEEECIADIRRSLREGMEEDGFIFCTSNCAYTGLDLDRYELMHRIWREEGVYPAK